MEISRICNKLDIYKQACAHTNIPRQCKHWIDGLTKTDYCFTELLFSSHSFMIVYRPLSPCGAAEKEKDYFEIFKHVEIALCQPLFITLYKSITGNLINITLCLEIKRSICFII